MNGSANMISRMPAPVIARLAEAVRPREAGTDAMSRRGLSFHASTRLAVPAKMYSG